MTRRTQHFVASLAVLVGGLVVLAAPSAVVGQVDTRVQTGNVLDANPQVGSGGANTPVRSYQPLDSQLYVNGQVTGLAGFRGNVPYSSPNELSIALPGDSVRSFRRRSVGLQQVMAGGTYQPQAYLDRAQATLNVGGITSGLAAPGSNVPMHSTLTREVARELFGQATSSYTRVIAPPGIVSTAMPAIGPEQLAPSWMTTPLARSAGAPDRPGIGATFQLPDLNDRQQLVREIRELGRQEEAEADGAYGEALDSRLDTAVDAEAFKPVDVPEPLTEEAVGVKRTDLPEPGEDVFHDVLMALRRQHAQDEEDRPDTEDAPSRRFDDEGNHILEAEEGLVSERLIMIRALGGKSLDYFNDFMRDGDSLLKEGRYYDAARKYEAATNVNPDNPLGHVGASLAMFGAGETYSASRHLRIAMVLFPPLMETRLDIAGMMDYPLFEKRLQQFKQEVREDAWATEDAAPLLLATYLHSCIGEDAEARIYAFRLRAAGRGNELYQAYARFVLTGKRPDEPDDPDDGKPAGEVISPEGSAAE